MLDDYYTRKGEKYKQHGYKYIHVVRTCNVNGVPHHV